MLQIIYDLDKTHYTNFIQYKQAYSMYMAISIIHTEVYNKSFEMTVAPLALLPVKINRAGARTATDETR